HGSRWKFSGRRVGSILKTRAAGSNGTAVITPDDVARMIYAKLPDGVPWDVTLRNLRNIARVAIILPATSPPGAIAVFDRSDTSPCSRKVGTRPRTNSRRAFSLAGFGW